MRNQVDNPNCNILGLRAKCRQTYRALTPSCADVRTVKDKSRVVESIKKKRLNVDWINFLVSRDLRQTVCS